MTWTPDKIATLKADWVAGKSAREIAAKVGVSRNAVIGKANRLKLPVHVNGEHVKHVVTYRGQRMSLTSAARAAGAGVSTALAKVRLDRGWDFQAAIETPPGRSGHYIRNPRPGDQVSA